MTINVVFISIIQSKVDDTTIKPNGKNMEQFAKM